MREGVLVLRRRIQKPKSKRGKLPAALRRSESAMSMGSEASDTSESGASESGASESGGGEEEEEEEGERHRMRTVSSAAY